MRSITFFLPASVAVALVIFACARTMKEQPTPTNETDSISSSALPTILEPPSTPVPNDVSKDKKDMETAQERTG
jgi:hypothetical protein